MEERESSEQIILGSSDPLVCPLLNLAIYLETALMEEWEANPFSTLGFIVSVAVKVLISI